MMNNFAEEALELIQIPLVTTEEGEAALVAAKALVFATLGLVEEQRTANLIAYLTFRSNNGSFPVKDAPMLLDIAARLGLN